MKNILFKETYLLFVIVVGLVSLSLYTTYSMFSYSKKTENNIVSMNISGYSLDLDVNQYELITLSKNEVKTIDLNIVNSSSNQLYYGVWYELISIDKLNDNVDLGYTEEVSNPTVGTVSGGTTKTTQVRIANYQDNDLIIKLGVVNAKDNNLELTDKQSLINNSFPEYLSTLIKKTEVNTYDINYEDNEFTVDNSGLFKDKNSNGTTYYYRGNIDNNYVTFANMLWRIVRVNEDNSIRLILNAPISCLTDTDNSFSYQDSCTNNISLVKYNKDESLDTSSVGYTNSTIKSYLDSWYEQFIKNYESSLSISSFCNDTSTGTYNQISNYSSYVRFNSYTPTFVCPDNQNEKYGGKYTDLYIGLLSMDEVLYGGLGSSYLYLDNSFWTMSPYALNSEELGSLLSYQSGNLVESLTSVSLPVRPVINIKQNIKFKTSSTTDMGTESNPYIIE